MRRSEKNVDSARDKKIGINEVDGVAYFIRKSRKCILPVSVCVCAESFFGSSLSVLYLFLNYILNYMLCISY